MFTFSCDAILFDLHGVLVDSTPCVTRVWSAWAQEHGLDAEHVVHVAHGRPTIATVREVAPNLDAQRETDRIEQKEIDDTDGLRVLPGAKELWSASVSFRDANEAQPRAPSRECKMVVVAP